MSVIRRSVVAISRRAYTASRQVSMAEPVAAAASSNLVLNFCTPHAAVYSRKVVDKVILPGEDGEYGVTAGISPIISQLRPGVVTIMHTGGETERFFVPGGFAISHQDSVTDVSVAEAVPVDDLDANAIKAGYAEALRNASGAGDDKAKAVAQIEANVFSALARAAGVAL